MNGDTPQAPVTPTPLYSTGVESIGLDWIEMN